MCGIVGVTGTGPALALLLDGLSRLEYRGYDSAGVALVDGGPGLGAAAGGEAGRAGGRRSATRRRRPPPASATPGGPPTAARRRPTPIPTPTAPAGWPWSTTGSSRTTSSWATSWWRPATSCAPRPTPRSWPTWSSRAWPTGWTLADAVRACLRRVEGSFAVAVVSAADPDLLVAARRGSPLIAGRTDGAALVASDIPAILPSTREIYVLDDDQVVEARPGRAAGDHPRRRRGHARAPPHPLRHRGGGEGGLRRLHAQGDPRAAPGRPGDAAGPHPGRAPHPRRAAAVRRRAARPSTRSSSSAAARATTPGWWPSTPSSTGPGCPPRSTWPASSATAAPSSTPRRS